MDNFTNIFGLMPIKSITFKNWPSQSNNPNTLSLMSLLILVSFSLYHNYLLFITSFLLLVSLFFLLSSPNPLASLSDFCFLSLLSLSLFLWPSQPITSDSLISLSLSDFYFLSFHLSDGIMVVGSLIYTVSLFVFVMVPWWWVLLWAGFGLHQW